MKKPSIVPLKLARKEEVIWGSETLLFYVKNGKGSLRYSTGEDKDGNLHSFLLMNDVPLVKLHADDEYYCPTCEKLLSAGYGRNMLDRSSIELIKNIGNQLNQPLQETLHKIEPFLYLLPSGLYGLAYIKLYPTNGDGEFFWDLSNTKKRYKSSCDIIHNFRYMNAYPAFLVPTQPTTIFDKDRVDYYRSRLKHGETFGGLAYYLDGFLCALLDGHHRATACLLEEKDFYCLTIIPVSGISYYNEGLKSFVIGGETFHYRDFPIWIRWKVEKGFQPFSLPTEMVEKYLALEQNQDATTLPMETKVLARKYPDYMGLSSIHWAGDLSDERIARLLQRQEEDWESELELVLKALIVKKDQRSKDVALRIAKSEECIFLWYDAFNYLSTIQSEEIEDFFIHYLVNDEGIRPELTRIANEYLKHR